MTIIKDFEAGTVTFEDESCRKVLHVGRHIMQSRHFHQVDRTVIASLAAREGACIDMDSLPAPPRWFRPKVVPTCLLDDDKLENLVICTVPQPAGSPAEQIGTYASDPVTAGRRGDPRTWAIDFESNPGNDVEILKRDFGTFYAAGILCKKLVDEVDEIADAFAAVNRMSSFGGSDRVPHRVVSMIATGPLLGPEAARFLEEHLAGAAYEAESESPSETTTSSST